jgi:hypothetical protein
MQGGELGGQDLDDGEAGLTAPKTYPDGKIVYIAEPLRCSIGPPHSNLGIGHLWPCLKKTVEIGSVKVLVPKRLNKLSASFQPQLLSCISRPTGGTTSEKLLGKGLRTGKCLQQDFKSGV